MLPKWSALFFATAVLLFLPCLSYAQSIFDIPDHCAVALKTDIYSSISTRDQDLAFASLVDEKTYDQVKHNANASASIPVTAGLVGGSASYSDFQEHRNSLYSTLNLHYTENDARKVFSATTGTRAFQSFDSCMKILATSAPGFNAWIISEDAHDVLIGCHFTAPGSGVLPLPVIITVDGGGAIAGKNTAAETINPGDDCNPIAVDRDGEGLLKVTLAGNGWPAAFVYSEYKKPPANIATLMYTPLVKRDEDVTINQENWFSVAQLQKTPDLDNAGGCKNGFPPEWCAGGRYAFPIGFNIDPPLDGDNYDPGQNVISSFRDWDGRHGGVFCGQYGISYTLISDPPADVPLPPEMRAHIHSLAAKHSLWVGIHCWGAPAMATIRYKRYHLVPSSDQVQVDVGFDLGEDFVIEPPVNTPSTIRIRYGNGLVALLTPGESSPDGKIQFKQSVQFAGSVLYVYHYAQ